MNLEIIRSERTCIDCAHLRWEEGREDLGVGYCAYGLFMEPIPKAFVSSKIWKVRPFTECDTWQADGDSHPSTTDLHRRAMLLYESAEKNKDKSKHVAEDYYRAAFRHEYMAAKSIPRDSRFEPSRSILYRSAATMAMDFDYLEMAVVCVSEGLMGDPPEEIERELYELLQVIYARYIITSQKPCDPKKLALLMDNAVGEEEQ